MNDDTNEPLGWTEAYFRAQQELARRWLDSASAASTGAANPFTWFAPFAAAAAPVQASATGATAGPFDDYFGLAREMWDTLAQAAQGASTPQAQAQAFIDGLAKFQRDWQAAWLAGFGLAQPGGAAVAGADGVLSALGLGAFGAPQSGFSMPNPAAALGPWVEAWQHTSSSYDTLALGITRERQESLQRLARHATRFTELQVQLLAQWGSVFRSALQSLGEQVAQRLVAGQLPQSVKEIYDLWVEIAEREYARVAHSQEYVRTQSELGNALSQYRLEQQRLIESVLRNFDLPTRSELDSLHKRVKELRGEVRRLTEALAGREAGAGNGRDAHAAATPVTSGASAGLSASAAAGARKKPRVRTRSARTQRSGS